MGQRRGDCFSVVRSAARWTRANPFAYIHAMQQASPTPATAATRASARRAVLRIVLLAIVAPNAALSFVLPAHSRAETPARKAESTVCWRRTVNGWERADLWEIHPIVEQTQAAAPVASLPLPLHPIVLAVLMIAAAGLLAIPNRSAKVHRRRGSPRR